MKKIFLLIFLLAVAIFGFTQAPPNTKINQGYYWYGGAFDRLHIPAFNTTPTLKSNQWSGAGAVGIDSVNNRFYFYSGGTWRQLSSGGSVAGNVGNIQINRNSGFAAAASDTLNYSTAGGLNVKNILTATGAGIGTTSITSSALLEVLSTTKGFLPPRLTTTQMNNISTPVAGLLVFNTDTASLFQYSGSAWQNVHGGTGGGGGGSPPGGNYGNVQLNRNGSFGAASTDSFTYSTSGGLAVKNIITGNAAAMGATSVAASAMLDLVSTTKGMLAPRMNTTQQNAISSPATGLLIFNTDSAFFRFYNGSTWQSMNGGGGGGSGEVNTASNLAGTGAALFKSKVGFDLQFKKLKAESNIIITDHTDSVGIKADTTAGDTKLATQGYVGRTLIGSSGTYFTYFKTGDNGQPAANDSTFSCDSCVGKFVLVWRNGDFQYKDALDGVTWDSLTGVIQFHPPLADAEKVYVEARSVTDPLVIGIGGSAGYTGGSTTYDADAQAYFDAEIAAGSSFTTADKNAWNAFFVALKDSSIWTSLKQAQFLAWGNFARSAINIKSPGTLDFSSSNGTITYSSGGALGNGSTGYIDAGLNPNSVFSNSNITIGVYSRTNNGTAAFDAGVSVDASQTQVIITGQGSGGLALTRIDDYNQTCSVSSSSLGFFEGSRTSSTSLTLYKNGSSIATNTTAVSNGKPNANVYVLAYDNNGSSAGLHSDRQISFYFIATSFTSTQARAMNNIVEVLMDYYGIGVQ